MPSHPDAAPAADPDDRTAPRTYILVLVVETLVIAALYWVGAHFA